MNRRECMQIITSLEESHRKSYMQVPTSDVGENRKHVTESAQVILVQIKLFGIYVKEFGRRLGIMTHNLHGCSIKL